jgi:electron transfer flavoprotein alpha subunit
MDQVLVLLHTDENGALPREALEALGAAAHLQPAAIAVVGKDAAGAAVACSGLAPRALCVEGDPFAAPRSSTDAAAAEAAARTAGATIVLAPGTSRWRRALPLAAARLDGVIDTHAVGLENLTVSRWFYRQRMEGKLTRAARPWFILLEPGAFEPAALPPPAAASAETAVLEPAAAPRTEVLGAAATAPGEQTIRPDAPLLFVAGAGWTKKQPDGQTHTSEAAELILGFVRAAACSLGSSKSLVDLSGEGQAVLPFLTHLHQVGQTGSTPRHKKGLATCCHGEEPHAVGWRFINERRAVNLDPNCGWSRGKADVLYVADAFEVLRELNKLL